LICPFLAFNDRCHIQSSILTVLTYVIKYVNKAGAFDRFVL